MWRRSIPEVLKAALTRRDASRLSPGWEENTSRTSSWCSTVAGTATSRDLSVTAMSHCQGTGAVRTCRTGAGPPWQARGRGASWGG
ncbi:hypothetical protein GCM10011509_04010 [Ornithinimicrobium pekingense]|uniref:Uncharacterized protein n=1 Tax=Ornithinimicrobium pekingense TaxID=384677 RepID=A0ABQ2F3M9_9MICO|nr:hypothetical protein GCM10011509_04010 [Ornithinimicrobium pekingense]